LIEFSRIIEIVNTKIVHFCDYDMI